MAGKRSAPRGQAGWKRSGAAPRAAPARGRAGSASTGVPARRHRLAPDPPGEASRRGQRCAAWRRAARLRRPGSRPAAEARAPRPARPAPSPGRRAWNSGGGARPAPARRRRRRPRGRTSARAAVHPRLRRGYPSGRSARCPGCGRWVPGRAGVRRRRGMPPGQVHRDRGHARPRHRTGSPGGAAGKRARRPRWRRTSTSRATRRERFLGEQLANPVGPGAAGVVGQPRVHPARGAASASGVASSGGRATQTRKPSAADVQPHRGAGRQAEAARLRRRVRGAGAGVAAIRMR